MGRGRRLTLETHRPVSSLQVNNTGLRSTMTPVPAGSRHDCRSVRRTQSGGGGMKLWGGRYAGDDEANVAAAFGRSVEIDQALALDDLDGSIAHVHGLGRAGILTDDEVATLVTGLEDLRR